MSLLLAAGGVAPTAGSPWYLWPIRARLDEIEGIVPSAINYQALYGRTTPAGPISGTPWYLWGVGPRPLESSEATPSVDLQAIHRYRPGFQTVGQPAWSLYTRVRLAEGEEITPPVDLGALHRYRVGYQTVGQPIWSLYWRGSVPVDDRVEIRSSLPANLYPYRGTVTVTVGQAWLLWPRGALPPAVEEPLYRVDYGKYQMLYGRTAPTPPATLTHYEINLGLSLSRFGGKTF
jgi:hypothetical protein